MTNLIVPNCKRLLKSRAFQITAAVVAAIGLFEIFMMYWDSIIEMETPYFYSELFSFAAVVCILVALLLVMQGIVIESMLEEPEFYAPEIILSDSGEVSYAGEMEPNPNYIPEGSPKRAFYNFLMDFTPGGQALQISAQAADNLSKICFYDIGWLVVITGAGVLIFRRKDLK